LVKEARFAAAGFADFVERGVLVDGGGGEEYN
jgi:hypothetical protein